MTLLQRRIDCHKCAATESIGHTKEDDHYKEAHALGWQWYPGMWTCPDCHLEWLVEAQRNANQNLAKHLELMDKLEALEETKTEDTT